MLCVLNAGSDCTHLVSAGKQTANKVFLKPGTKNMLVPKDLLSFYFN
jgi:hypothetical protein